MTAAACDRARIFCHGLLGSFPGLTGFATDLFASIANPFAVIGLGRSDTPDFRGGLTDDFPVITEYLDLTRFLIHFKRDSGWRRHFHRMGITDEQCQVFSLQFSAVAHTLN